MNCPKMLRMSCLRTVKVRRAVAAAEAGRRRRKPNSENGAPEQNSGEE